MQLIPVLNGNVRLSVMTLGPAQSLERPCVFLHGLVTGNISTWYSVAALEMARDRQVILYDLRGHGDSAVPASGYDLDTQAEDLTCVLEATLPDGEMVDLVGHSLGALIALRFALKMRHRVGRLILVDAPMPACDWVRPSLEQVQSPQALDDWLRSAPDMIGQLTGRRLERLSRRLQQLFFETSLVRDVCNMQAESPEDLSSLALPVTLVYGKQSPCRPVANTLRKLLPIRALMLIDCGHYIPSEAPEPLRDVVVGTLRHEADEGIQQNHSMPDTLKVSA
jgi:pimeloyl-ACP methyl ester carboxylesterase